MESNIYTFLWYLLCKNLKALSSIKCALTLHMLFLLQGKSDTERGLVIWQKETCNPDILDSCLSQRTILLGLCIQPALLKLLMGL